MIIKFCYFLLSFLPFPLLFLALFQAFGVRKNPSHFDSNVDRTRIFHAFSSHFHSGKKDGIPVPTLFILRFIHTFIHTLSTGISELCIDFAMSLFWMSRVYYGFT
jgi:hypothetical protein